MLCTVLGVGAACLLTHSARGQLASQAGGSPQSGPQQVPLSGRSSGGAGVTVEQRLGGFEGSDSVQTINTTIQVGGSYSGSVYGKGAASLGGRVLTIAEALRRGLLYNLGTRAAQASELQAKAGQEATRSALLPTISAQFSENVAKVNLASSGFDASSIPSIGQFFPSTIGPFNYYSAQANVSDSLFDLVELRNRAVSQGQSEAARFGTADAREQVVLAVAGTYLRILSDVALGASEEAQVKQS